MEQEIYEVKPENVDLLQVFNEIKEGNRGHRAEHSQIKVYFVYSFKMM